jgi:L-fuculose-phosphate aldolase
MLLANHGALAAGTDLFSAYNKMEVLEHSAHITFNSMQLGKMNLITEEKKKILIDLRKKFNFSGRIIE